MRQILLLSCLLINGLTHADSLAAKIDALINKSLPQASIGIVVKELRSGKLIYSKNGNTLLSPASGTKLFTAAAALYHLSPGYVFKTTLSQDQQNVYLTFNGSPSFTTANLYELLDSLSKNHIKTIPGNIIIDSSRFKPPSYAAGISYDDLGWYYTAPTTAVIINGNEQDFAVKSAKQLGMPVQIKAKNAGQGLTIINDVITVSNDQEKYHCNLNVEIKPANTIRIFGCLAQNKQPQLWQFAIPDPVLLTKQLIKDSLKKQGIVLKGTIAEGKAPTNIPVLASIESKNLAELSTHMLQESDNLYANSFYKSLAYSVTGEGSFKQGAFALRKVLAKHTAIDTKQIDLSDGAGARYNLVTAEQVVVLLTNLYQDKDLSGIFVHALAQAGVSGTLKERMKNTKLAKTVFAKTGTMHDVSSLSGYYLGDPKHPLVFSIIMNGVNAPISKAKALEEQILTVISDNVV